MKNSFRFVIYTFITAIATLITQPAMSQREYVKSLDVQRYLGTWYEIARFTPKFEKDLVGTTATYSLNPDGTIKVVNAGHLLTLGGKVQTAYGKAKFAGKEQNGHLKVSFFLFFYADYFIMALDNDYQWALIGSKSDKYLWVLSRTPQMDKDVYDRILEKARSLGYDLSKLDVIPQVLP
jgi:apolipoprotein D and lipocalin family protein